MKKVTEISLTGNGVVVVEFPARPFYAVALLLQILSKDHLKIFASHFVRILRTEAESKYG
jgi:hypothetical protein